MEPRGGGTGESGTRSSDQPALPIHRPTSRFRHSSACPTPARTSPSRPTPRCCPRRTCPNAVKPSGGFRSAGRDGFQGARRNPCRAGHRTGLAIRGAGTSSVRDHPDQRRRADLPGCAVPAEKRDLRGRCPVRARSGTDRTVRTQSSPRAVPDATTIHGVWKRRRSAKSRPAGYTSLKKGTAPGTSAVLNSRTPPSSDGRSCTSTMAKTPSS